MKLAEAQKWLGLYFLMTTGITGAVILLFGGGTIVPMEEKDVSNSFQIIIPVLLGQLTVIFQWLARQEAVASNDAECPVPAWAIRTPPVLGATIMCAAVVLLFVSNRPGMTWIRFGPNRFQTTLTFVTGLLNASTILLVTRLFPSTAAAHAQGENASPLEPEVENPPKEKAA
ncbi:hypothetical protein [Archangium sp.]|uniref:hypothetical protein n=1 Tax=Archangium sp. TaxID=1872627 RepID=UPI003899F9A6